MVAHEDAFEHGDDGGLFAGVEVVEGAEQELEVRCRGAAFVGVE